MKSDPVNRRGFLNRSFSTASAAGMAAQETIDFMKTVTKPWIAFKVLAAGAIMPQQGFTYAFKNGADFIAVGMLDFQVRGDCTTNTKDCENFHKDWPEPAERQLALVGGPAAL